MRRSSPLAISAILEPMLTIAQTAQLLQVSTKTIRRHIADGALVANARSVGATPVLPHEPRPTAVPRFAGAAGHDAQPGRRARPARR